MVDFQAFCEQRQEGKALPQSADIDKHDFIDIETDRKVYTNVEASEADRLSDNIVHESDVRLLPVFGSFVFRAGFGK